MGLDKLMNNSYKLTSSDNMAAFLDAMKVPGPVKESILTSTPIVTIKGCGGNYTVQTRSSYHDRDITFTPGVEFEDLGFDGKPVRCVVKVNGTKLTREVLTDPKCTVISDFTGDHVNVTYTAGGINATQVYKKV